LNDILIKNNFSSISINSDNTSIERITILRNFKQGKYKCLVTTDLLSRGIDIQQLSFVINYELPNKNNLSSYIHRIGRSGRYGKKGLSINLINTQTSNYRNKYSKNKYRNTENELAIQTLIMATFKCNITPLTENNLKHIE
jgi:superfamily II DNA/RNA helicase